MQLTILPFLLLVTFSTFYQAKTSIVGKWKLVRLSGEEMNMNFETDSVIFSGELKEEISSSKDSTAVAKIIANIIKVSEGFILFTKDGIFEDILVLGKDTMVEKGTYTIDKQKSTIKSTTSRGNSLIKKEDMLFIVKGKELHIRLLPVGKAPEHSLSLVYERVE